MNQRLARAVEYDSLHRVPKFQDTLGLQFTDSSISPTGFRVGPPSPH